MLSDYWDTITVAGFHCRKLRSFGPASLDRLSAGGDSTTKILPHASCPRSGGTHAEASECKTGEFLVFTKVYKRYALLTLTVPTR